MDVNFQHWKYEFSEETLVRLGSPYFSDRDIGRQLRQELLSLKAPATEIVLTFGRDQILCGNEAFPEAAVADPLTDLEIWEEWMSGIRAFPYPGRYSRLRITSQEPKTSSPSSVGVLGEILAGYLAQSFISPWILVRVIRRWPDFIFHAGDDRYAFVESKAFRYRSNQTGHMLTRRVPDRQMDECLVSAIRQVTADSCVVVWGAFTNIVALHPQPNLEVTFLELSAPAPRRRQQPGRHMPEAVIEGLAQRAIIQASADLTAEELKALESERKRRKPKQHTQHQAWLLGHRAEDKLLYSAHQRMEDVLSGAGTSAIIDSSRDRLTEAITKTARKMVFHGESEGRRLLTAKKRASEGVLSKIRELGRSSMFVADLPRLTRTSVEDSWTSDWRASNRPFARFSDSRAWRCGGAVFCLGPSSLEGEAVPTQNLR